ncbi:MAG TPA: type I restriction-modification enzyme R subunit C-terminal domain-containing protein [Coleofasciculaceae cyanobacterium]
MEQLLKSRSWTAPQRQWLERIGKELKQETIVDREAFDQEQFRDKGGFTRINKIFEGQLEALLTEVGDRIWQAS